MLFRVTAPTGSDTSTPPDRLVLPAIAPLAPVGNTRQVSLNEMSSALLTDSEGETIGPMSAALGSVTLDPAPAGTPLPWGAPISEKPKAGTTEQWEIYNFTEDAHPIHIHQTMFEVVNREVVDPAVGTPGTIIQPEPGKPAARTR